MAIRQIEGAKIATMAAIYPQQMSAFRHNLAQFKPHHFEAESIYQTTQRVRQLIESFGDKTTIMSLLWDMEPI